jgi:hypothetical protein
MSRKEISRPHPQVRSAVPHHKRQGSDLKDYDPGETCGRLGKGEASELLQQRIKWLTRAGHALRAGSLVARLPGGGRSGKSRRAENFEASTFFQKRAAPRPRKRALAFASNCGEAGTVATKWSHT